MWNRTHEKKLNGIPLSRECRYFYSCSIYEVRTIILKVNKLSIILMLSLNKIKSFINSIQKQLNKG